MSFFSLLGAVEIGLIFSLVALGVFISFRLLRFPDLTVDGSFPLGGAVCAILISTGTNAWLATLAERGVSRAMGGSCSMPLAAFAEWQAGPSHDSEPVLVLKALLGHPEQPFLVHASATDRPRNAAEADAMGRQIAAQLQAQAGEDWLAAL